MMEIIAPHTRQASPLSASMLAELWSGQMLEKHEPGSHLSRMLGTRGALWKKGTWRNSLVITCCLDERKETNNKMLAWQGSLGFFVICLYFFHFSFWPLWAPKNIENVWKWLGWRVRGPVCTLLVHMVIQQANSKHIQRIPRFIL